MSTESVSSNSSLQVSQLVEDQLSDEELEMVAGGVLSLTTSNTKPAPYGNPRIPSSNGGFPSSPVGIEDIPDICDTFTS